MNFFEHQDVARKKTGRLILLFIASVVLTIVAAEIVVLGVVKGVHGYSNSELRTSPGVEPSTPEPPWPMIAGGVALGVLVLVGGGTLFKISQLSAGGSVIAEHLGGRPILPDTTDASERKILNVVEEMSIASGSAVPRVYVMDESSINAFAAGFSPGDAVIGVTRGTIEQLDRDELQGVVAHEFSHILSGDMRTNMRLTGLIFGIVLIGVAGQFMLRSAFYAGAARRSRDNGGGAFAIAAMGIGLMIVGFIGTFFGSLIKSAVSRQREYFADASAVQFTRNPHGIADALRRIGGHPKHAAIFHPNAPEASHMFFGQAVPVGFASLFATHPPLKDRIKRVDPSWDGSYLERRSAPAPARGKPAKPGERERSRMMSAVLTGAAVADLTGPAPASGHTADSIAASVGTLTPTHVAHARELLSRVPPVIYEAAHDPFSSRAVVLMLLLDRDPEMRARQLESLGRADRPLRDAVVRLIPRMAELDAAARLPLIDLALPALREMSRPQYASFRSVMRGLVEADNKIDIFEWALSRILTRHLGESFGETSQNRIRYYALAKLGRECSLVLSTLAHLASRDGQEIEAAFRAGASRLSAVSNLSLLPRGECRLSSLDEALGELASVAPKPKQGVITACIACVIADNRVTTREAEVLRAVSDALGCPMPPLLPDQPLA